MARAAKPVPGPKGAAAAVPDANLVLGAIPEKLRAQLLEELSGVERNYRESRWKPAELDGGRLCEVVYSILRGHVDGRMPASAEKPKNFLQACRDLQNAAGFPHSVRVTIPRMLTALYELRNNRGVGHVGGEVDPNHMDATVVLAMSKWLMAEVVRLFHDEDPGTANDLVDALVERDTPLVWDTGGRKRVLNTDLAVRDRTLLLLHATAGAVLEATIRDWVESKNSTRYRREILENLHSEKYVEYDTTAKTVTLSPKGRDYVEASLKSWVPRGDVT